MQRAGFLFLAILMAGCASPPGQRPAPPSEPASAERMCRIAQCGHGIRVELREKDGSLFSRTFDALPVVQEAGVSVYAGNTVLFEAEPVNGELTRLRLVDKVANPERTLSARLEQNEDGGMMLVTSNPFGQPLRIRMGIMPLDADGLMRTSSCPVVAGGSSYELWPEPIFQVFLGDMRLMSGDEPLSCIE